MSDYNVVSGKNQIPFQNKANTILMFKFSAIIPIELEYNGGYNEIEIKSHICLNSIENIVDSKTLYCGIANYIVNYEHNVREMLISDTDTLVLYFEFPDYIDVDSKYVVMDINGFNFNFTKLTNNIWDIGTIKTVYDSILQNTNKSEQIHVNLFTLYGYH